MGFNLKEQLNKYYKTHQKPQHLKFSYGTAGFRTKANTLDSVVFVVGLLASLRSKYLNCQTIGIMITASHNPPEDNGIKICDPQGEMLEQSWETYATTLANLQDAESIIEEIIKLTQKLNINLETPSNVIIARDSRESGHILTESTIDGLKVFNTTFKDFHFLTTPQLHYLVKAINTQNLSIAYGKPSEEGYYEKLSKAFIHIYENFVDSKDKIKITIDAANGIGGPKVKHLIDTYLSNYIDYELVNNNYKDAKSLNVSSGADYVKTNQKLPLNVSPIPLNLYTSFDGDADRIIFYYNDENNQFHLLDGDKISTLLASFLQDLVSRSGLLAKVGVVQTAYANGSSTNFLTNILKVPVVCTPTGVKHLHHETKKFDIGIYFEANGHGTVLFSEIFLETLSKASPSTLEEQRSIDILYQLAQLINQTVGDAISDLLAVLIVLSIKKWNPINWDESYIDLPNKLTKVIVPDRNVFKTINAERQLISPAGLQDKIDAIIVQYKNGRSFVRASGTEDVVRIYAEAETRSKVNELSQKVSKIVKEISDE